MTPISPITLRPATPGDRDAIIDVFWACWTVSYAAVLPATMIARLDRRGAEQLWTSVLPLPDVSTQVAVDADGRVVGMTRWSDDTVHSLYVHPDAQGVGAGRRLLEHSSTALAANGVDPVRLWVFRDNTPSRAFYSSQGWEPDGHERVKEGFGEPEVRLAKRVPIVGAS